MNRVNADSSRKRARTLIPALFSVLCFLTTNHYPLTTFLYAQTEFGVEDDLTALGVDGTALDPDAEIKGFTVFGSTQAAYAGAAAAPGNVVVNGALTVSSGAYFVGDSTFPAANKIFVNDGSAGQMLRKNSGGYLEWSSISDNLGDHVATTTLQMGVYGINSSSDIAAARYQINGSTILAVLPGAGSLGAGVDAGMASAGDHNAFLGYNAGYSNTTGADNAFLGYKAGYYTQSGSGNAVFGGEAGRGVLNNSFSGSTLMGYQAGYGLTTGAGNILLGFQSGYGITAGGGNIVIGYAEDTSGPGASDELNIGGVLFGDLSAGTIGISTRIPQAALDIVSTGTASDQFAQLWRNSAGTIVSSVSATGVIMAVKFVGDGSELNGVAGSGDNFGDHTATTTVNMADFPIVNISSAQISGTGVSGDGALFQIAGSTLAVLNNGNVGIGTAAPGVKLEVAGQVKITGGSPAAGNVLTSDAAGLADWQSPPAPTGMPSGLSMFFNLASCPLGWTELTSAQGRYLVGTPSGGTLAGTAGTALTDLENRAVGQHTHTITDPGHAHMYQKPTQSNTIASGSSTTRYLSTMQCTSATTGIILNSTGAVAGTNAPYVQLRLCQKD